MNDCIENCRYEKQLIVDYIKSHKGAKARRIAKDLKIPIYKISNCYLRELVQEDKIKEDREASVIKYYPVN